MNIINTRIIHTHDVESNWELIGDYFIPQAGEIIVYDVDEQHKEERFKIGDDRTYLNQLKFFNSTPSVTEIFESNDEENSEICLDAGRIQ